MLSRAQALLGALPAGVDWVTATAFGRRPPRGRLERAASPVVPAVIGLLLLLAIVPLIFAGLELIIHRTSAKELVDRVTGPSITLVELAGLAQLPPIPAPPREDGTPMRYYFVRDAAARRDVVVVRSDVTPEQLTTREVTGVIEEDPERLAFDATALAGRGARGAQGASLDADTLGARYLREDPTVGEATEIAVSEIGERAVGTIVRVRLRFGTVAIPGCGSSADDPCEIAALAGGRAHFDHLAFDPDSGAPLIVRTAYPAAVVPMRVYGTQVTDRDPLDELFATPTGSILGGWGRELRTAWIDRDPDLPVDRPWLAPILLLAFAGLLLAGRRVGYPVFRLTDAAAALDPAAGVPTGALDVIASGRLSQASGGPIDVDRVPGRLGAGPGWTTVELHLDGPGGPIRSVISRALREVSAVERGDLVHVHGREPALALHWFGNDVMLAFASDEDRDRAAALLSG